MRRGFDWVTLAIVLAGTALYVHYLSYTSVAERNYDGAAHLEYIQSIASRWRVPNVYACGPCGHPPAYYLLAAIWGKAVSHVSSLPLELALQWLSLLLFACFVATSLLIFRGAGVGLGALRLATALVVFWPSSVLNSSRVHNDALAAPLMLGAIYLMAQWDERGRNREFLGALLLCVLALFTKSSAYPVAALLVGLSLVRLRSAAARPAAFRRCVLAAVVLTAAAVTAVAFRESRQPTTLCQKVLGLACDGRYVPTVADTLGYFIRFDVGGFVRGLPVPSELVEREPFLNRLARSSLFGIMPLGDELRGPRQALLAPLLGSLLLALVLACMVAAPFVRRQLVAKQHRVYLAAPCVLLAFLVAFRVRAPNEFHEDFRHIFPALVPFCLGYASVVEWAGRRSRLLGICGTVAGVALALASAAFFVRFPSEVPSSLTAPPAAAATEGNAR